MAHKTLRFTDEELTQANNVNLMDYAISIGLELKKVGKDSYHIEGYGGLYINPILNKWNCKDYNEDLINTTYNQIFTKKNMFLRRGEEEKFNLEL